MSVLSDKIRQEFGESDKKRDAGLKTPEDVIRYDDIVYGSDSKMQCLDVYRPRIPFKNDTSFGQNITVSKKLDKLPVIVSVHGGAWVYGSKEIYQFYCMSLAQRGFAVVNFTYRLAPENKFPACLEDVAAVFQWVLDHGEEYGLDTNHIFAVGDSAGGHMLSMFCTLCCSQEYREKFSFSIPENFAPKAVALNCGAYHINLDEKGDTDEMTRDIMADFLEFKGTPEELDLINPIPYITKDFPPAMVMTSNEDFLKHEAPLLIEKLEEVGVPYVSRLYGDEKNPQWHVFHLNMSSAEGKACNDEQCQYFQSFL